MGQLRNAVAGTRLIGGCRRTLDGEGFEDEVLFWRRRLDRKSGSFASALKSKSGVLATADELDNF